MRACRLIPLLLVLVPLSALAQNKTKKHANVSAAFASARYVYVQAQDGDITKPGLFPEDRQAISDVLDGIEAWNRYAVVISENKADLVFIVRKGRFVGIQGRGGIASGPGLAGPPPQNRQPGQFPDGDSVGVGTEVGPPDDLLQVFTTNPEGKRIGPIWQREMKDGLDAPSVQLLRELKAEVERAYPNPPPKKQP